jgi:hypothetical protein
MTHCVRWSTAAVQYAAYSAALRALVAHTAEEALVCTPRLCGVTCSQNFSKQQCHSHMLPQFCQGMAKTHRVGTVIVINTRESSAFSVDSLQTSRMSFRWVSACIAGTVCGTHRG